LDVPDTARMAEATLTDEMIEAMKAKIGLELRIDHSTNNEVATRLAITRFADGIGDTNPLWRDETYAAGTVYGRLAAPPSFVICCFSGLQFGWPGLGSFHANSELTFHQPILVGDTINATCTYEGFDGPRPSSFAEKMVVDHFRNRYRNQAGELVAEIHWTVVNFERQRAKAKSTERSVELPHPWTDAELEAIERDVLAEQPRGAQPRFFEDVHVGDQLDLLTKGPIGTTDEIAFVASGGAPIPRLAAHRAALQAYRAHPAWAFRDPDTMALEPIYSVHYNRHAARAMGVAMQYDVGFQRQCWHIQLLTDWMGDDGWVIDAEAQYRSFVFLSDVIRLGGRVVAKRISDDGERLVDIETWAHNQRGQDVMPGKATVALPSREVGANPVHRRMRPGLTRQALFTGWGTIPGTGNPVR
jgi:acyl dehydratase